jgi:GNAT superfamily N-acetyltransferase
MVNPAIRPCTPDDFEAIYAIINDAARAYRGVIPADRYHEPYMPREELHEAIRRGVVFWGYEEPGETPGLLGDHEEPGDRARRAELVGVMGIQDVEDVTLIRHAYVRTDRRQHGVGGRLLSHLLDLSTRPVLIGTWTDAAWAIRFYEKHGFRLVPTDEKTRLLRRYWGISERQIETSVVLADAKWRGGKSEKSATP